MTQVSPDPACVLLIDKPYEWTSFGVVKRIRYTYKLRKVGHAGTLDPLATGLLILCTGKKTKEIESFMGLPKTYTGTMVLGKKSPSHDLETEVEEVADTSGLNSEEIEKAVESFRGSISQTPPQHSAVKVNGKRAYKSARAGQKVEIKPKEVIIDLFEVKWQAPELHFKVICSKGTYIRSLVRDLGDKLQVGAVMTSLRREAIGDFKVDDAYSVDDLPDLQELKSSDS